MKDPFRRLLRRRRYLRSRGEKRRLRKVWADLVQSFVDFDHGIFPTLLWLWVWPRRLMIGFFSARPSQRYTSPFRLGFALTFLLFLVLTKLDTDIVPFHRDPQDGGFRFFLQRSEDEGRSFPENAKTLNDYEDELLALFGLLFPLTNTVLHRILFLRGPYGWIHWLSFNFYTWSAVILPFVVAGILDWFWGVPGLVYVYCGVHALLYQWWAMLTVPPVRWYYRVFLTPVVILMNFFVYMLVIILLTNWENVVEKVVMGIG